LRSSTRMAGQDASRSTPLLQKHIALPNQHGSWAMLVAPFVIGAGVAGGLNAGTAWLAIAALGLFLALQPMTVLVKIRAGRKAPSSLKPARFWLLVYSVLALSGGLGLLAAGHGRVFWLALPALPVMGWYMWLVARREERGQAAAEIAGAGVLALAAPAAYWVGGGAGSGLVLWLLAWMQSAGGIVYVFVKLVYRRMKAAPAWPERLRLSRMAISVHLLMLGVAGMLAIFGWIPWPAILAFVFLLAETLYGSLVSPGAGVKPAAIGVRQILVTAVFTVLLILAFQP